MTNLILQFYGVRPGDLKRCARGCWQRELVTRLVEENKVPAAPGSLLHGRALLYQGHYEESLVHLLGRLRRHVSLQYIAGPRGGRWCGYWQVPLPTSVQQMNVLNG